MDQSAGHIFDAVLSTTSPQVPIGVEIPLQVPIHSRGQRKATNVKFAILVQQRSLTVLLNDVGALAPIHGLIRD